MAVGAFGATAAVMVRAQRDVALRPRPRWVLEGAPAAGVAARPLGARAGAARARPTGRIVEEPFDATGEDPTPAARRALAVVGGSIAPNRSSWRSTTITASWSSTSSSETTR